MQMHGGDDPCVLPTIGCDSEHSHVHDARLRSGVERKAKHLTVARAGLDHWLAHPRKVLRDGPSGAEDLGAAQRDRSLPVIKSDVELPDRIPAYYSIDRKPVAWNSS